MHLFVSPKHVRARLKTIFWRGVFSRVFALDVRYPDIYPVINRILHPNVVRSRVRQTTWPTQQTIQHISRCRDMSQYHYRKHSRSWSDLVNVFRVRMPPPRNILVYFPMAIRVHKVIAAGASRIFSCKYRYYVSLSRDDIQ